LFENPGSGILPAAVNEPSAISESDRNHADVLAGLIEYLRYQQEIGVDEVEIPGMIPIPARVAKQPQDRPAATPAPTSPPPAEPPPPGNEGESLTQIAARIAACTQCALCDGRRNTVPGQGAETPEIMFVGEGPGADEDRQGIPFVGRAGELLTRMIVAMGLSRDEVFIANVVKCRPPGNRNPSPLEMSACMPYLEQQIETLKPTVIVALGSIALKGLLGEESISITRMRGSWLKFKDIDLMPTFHPAYLLRNPDFKRDVWNDMQAVLHRIGRKPPSS